jgi:hypothetical protein
MSVKEKTVGLWLLPLEPELNLVLSYDLVLEVRRANTLVAISEWYFIPQAKAFVSTAVQDGIGVFKYRFQMPAKSLPSYLKVPKTRVLLMFNASDDNEEVYLFPAGISGIPILLEGNTIVLDASLFKAPKYVYPPYLLSKQPTDEEVLNTSEILTNPLSVNALRYYSVPVE